MVVASTKKVRLAQRRRKRRIIKIFVSMSALVLLYALLIYGLTIDKIGIHTINIVGNTNVDGRALEASTAKHMATLRAHSLYSATIFTYDEDVIVRALMYEYPRLKSVELSSSSVNELDVEVNERTTALKWCGESWECYLVDSSGYIFAKAGTENGLVKYTGAINGEPLRKTLIPGKLTQVHEFIDLLKRIGVDVTVVDVLGDELSINSAEHPTLKVKLDEYLERTAGYVEATLKSADYKEYQASMSTSTPVYIDLRFDNRVYYK